MGVNDLRGSKSGSLKWGFKTAQNRAKRKTIGVGLGWLGRASTALSLRSAFGAPFSHRVFAFRCCLCFRHSYLTHPRPRGMRINALKATVLATLNCVTLVSVSRERSSQSEAFCGRFVQFLKRFGIFYLCNGCSIKNF